MSEQLYNRRPLLKFRKSLRNESTPEEAMLWKALRNSQLNGRKFRRQYSVGNYILDFYCPSERIAIELDGHPHFNPGAQQADLERDEWLQGKEIKVLRFPNHLVREQLGNVLEAVKQEFEN